MNWNKVKIATSIQFHDLASELRTIMLLWNWFNTVG